MQSNLVKRGFLSLVATQFFGAMNDNVLKGILMFMVIDGVWSGQLGAGGQGIVSVCFTIPFILLSGYAGQLADRHSKRTVTMWVKIAEIPIAIVAGIGFYTGNLWITLSRFDRADLSKFVLRSGQVWHDSRTGRRLRSQPRQRHDQHDDQRRRDRRDAVGRASSVIATTRCRARRDSGCRPGVLWLPAVVIDC